MTELSPRKVEVIRRFAAELAALPIAQIEEVLREEIARDLAELRTKYPELFRDEN